MKQNPRRGPAHREESEMMRWELFSYHDAALDRLESVHHGGRLQIVHKRYGRNWDKLIIDMDCWRCAFVVNMSIYPTYVWTFNASCRSCEGIGINYRYKFWYLISFSIYVNTIIEMIYIGTTWIQVKCAISNWIHESADNLKTSWAQSFRIENYYYNRMKPYSLYLTRRQEGFQNILIQRHLLKDDSMFRKFFRLYIEHFNYIISSCLERVAISW